MHLRRNLVIIYSNHTLEQKYHATRNSKKRDAIRNSRRYKEKIKMISHILKTLNVKLLLSWCVHRKVYPCEVLWGYLLYNVRTIVKENVALVETKYVFNSKNRRSGFSTKSLFCKDFSPFRAVSPTSIPARITLS